MKYFLIWFILMPLISVAQKRSLIGIEAATYQVKQAIKNKTDYPKSVTAIIGDQKTAIGVAELILFKIYGERNIIKP
jgi:hypothetical protein